MVNFQASVTRLAEAENRTKLKEDRASPLWLPLVFRLKTQASHGSSTAAAGAAGACAGSTMSKSALPEASAAGVASAALSHLSSARRRTSGESVCAVSNATRSL